MRRLQRFESWLTVLTELSLDVSPCATKPLAQAERQREVADGAEPHRSFTEVEAKLFIVD
jgi:hypothetical protein